MYNGVGLIHLHTVISNSVPTSLEQDPGRQTRKQKDKQEGWPGERDQRRHMVHGDSTHLFNQVIVLFP